MPRRGRQRQRSRSPIPVDSDRVVMHRYRKVQDEQREYSGVEGSNPPVCAFLYTLSLFDALIAHRDFDDYSTFGVVTIRRRQQQGERNPGEYLHSQEETAIAPEVEEEEEIDSVVGDSVCASSASASESDHQNPPASESSTVVCVPRPSVYQPTVPKSRSFAGVCDIGQSIAATKANFCTICPPNWQAGSLPVKDWN